MYDKTEDTENPSFDRRINSLITSSVLVISINFSSFFGVCELTILLLIWIFINL